MAWTSNIKRKEVHYLSEKETNGFHCCHGNKELSLPDEPVIRYFAAAEHHYCKVKWEIFLFNANRW